MATRPSGGDGVGGVGGGQYGLPCSTGSPHRIRRLVGRISRSQAQARGAMPVMADRDRRSGFAHGLPMKGDEGRMKGNSSANPLISAAVE
jgi:hypothetical protein